MREAKDTVLRYLALLQVLPLHPKKISTLKIRVILSGKNSEFDVDIRTIQRDLERLSDMFPITCDKVGRVNYWYWQDKHALTLLPAMDDKTAIAFRLAADYLGPIMPPRTLELLGPYLNHAAKVLSGSRLGKWPEQTRIIQRGPALIPPAIKKNVQDIVYQALLEEKQFEAGYKGRDGERATRYTLNPQAIVVRDGIIYLVATTWNYKDPRHYTLHRMSDVRLLETPAGKLPGFSLTRHIEEDKEFSYPHADRKIRLRAIFSEDAAIHLKESKLSLDQKIKTLADGRLQVSASVSDTDDLRWWLLGYGDQVEVIKPVALRREIKQVAENLQGIYSENRKRFNE